MRLFLLTAAMAAIWTMPAGATDPVVPSDAGPAAFEWSGFYVGVLAGYGWQDTRHCDDAASSCYPTNPSYTSEGWLAGATVGYNFQFANNIVLGIEGDYAAAEIDGSSLGGFGFGCAGSCYSEIDAIGTIRARLGYAFDRFLPYATAGAAFDRSTAGLGVPAFGERTEWQTSAVVGGGLEYAFTDRLSAKIDYLYVFNGGDLVYGGCGSSNCYTDSEDTDLVRVGLNFGF